MSTETAVARLEANEVALVKRTVANGATDDELRLFLHDCARQGVHPLDKLIHFSKRGGKYTPITSIDFMRARADDTGAYAGNDDPEYEFRGDEKTIPYSASVTVWKIVGGVRCPFKATAKWSEYLPPKGNDFMWLKMPSLMLGKCAEALALRKAFPKQLHGIYERAEMMQAGAEGGDPPQTPASVQQRVEAGHMETPPVREDDPVLVAESETLFPDNTDVERERLLNELRTKATKAKISQKDKDAAWDTYVGKGVTPSKADPAALADLLKWVEARTR